MSAARPLPPVDARMEALYRTADQIHADLVRTGRHRLDRNGVCATCATALQALDDDRDDAREAAGRLTLVENLCIHAAQHAQIGAHDGQ